MIDYIPGPVAGTASPCIVAGIGLRAGAQGSDVLELIDTCLDKVGLARVDIAALATLDRKRTHVALCEAAATLGVPVLPVAATQLSVAAPNPSQRVRQHVGISSVAEATAMQFGPLLLEKHCSASVTCALARLDGPQDSTGFSAARAASTLSTSWAGP